MTQPSRTEPAAPAIQPPPYRAALVVFAAVLAVYVWTLAPTVTFWDAGEFIATARILGIPHPPGTPLFVVLANVWGTLLPIGDFAYRANLMTATFSAAASGIMFLLVAQSLRGWRPSEDEGEGTDDLFTIGGAVAAALASAFAFTVWQNSNETEVYMVAAFSIAAICWLAWLWRKHRGGERAPHLLLLIIYLGAVSIGNHLLTLLVGPALIVFMWHVLRTEPLAKPDDRSVEWAQWAVLAGVWALLIGTGLGSTGLLILGGLIFLGAAIYAATVGGARFALTVLGIAAIGVSTYLFLYLRAKVGPFINEADPSTWDNLLAVIRREQYPPRSPIDNPIFPSGPENPGRSLSLIGLQLANYLQYFDWQWSNGLAATEPVFAKIRLPFTLLFVSLGMYGAAALHGRDRSVFWLLAILFLTTGPGLMGYMNFKPGFSLAWDRYPGMDMHEVRERDYFFTVSFQVWGVFAGMGIAGLYRMVRGWVVGRSEGQAVESVRSESPAARPPDRPTAGPSYAAAAVFVLALLPFALNFKASSRAHGPEARLARDFAYDLLQSVEPYGIVFTNGDNDTFPLWYLQEVEQVRQDVVVVNLSLANTDWYIRQLRDNPVRTFKPEEAPWFAPLAPDSAPGPVHSWQDVDIANLRSTLLPRASTFRAGRVAVSYPENTPLYVMNLLTLQLIRENWNKRPIYFALTAGTGSWIRLDRYLTQEALVFRLHAAEPPDTSGLAPGLFGVPLDAPRTEFLADSVYRYAGLLDAETLELDPTNSNIAANLSYVFYGLSQAYEVRGDPQKARELMRRGYRLNPIAQVASLLDAPPESLDILLGDTVGAP